MFDDSFIITVKHKIFHVKFDRQQLSESNFSEKISKEISVNQEFL